MCVVYCTYDMSQRLEILILSETAVVSCGERLCVCVCVLDASTFLLLSMHVCDVFGWCPVDDDDDYVTFCC